MEGFTLIIGIVITDNLLSKTLQEVPYAHTNPFKTGHAVSNVLVRI